MLFGAFLQALRCLVDILACGFNAGGGLVGDPEGRGADLFNKFVQLDRPKGGEGYKGTGLGLAICREIMTINGGRIWAENVKGKGAGFYIALPAAEQAAAAAAAGGRHDASEK